MAGTAPILALDGVSRSFDDGRIVGVDNVTLDIGRSEVAAVYGPSGSGKSTLLNLMAGLDVPTRGTVAYDGRIVPSAAGWTRLRGERIGIVFQDFNLLPTLTASENIEVAIFGRVSPAAERRRRAAARLAEVGLAHCARRLPRELSGGERRRVGIARALVNDPELLLADEPTANLDSHVGGQVLEMFRALAKQENRALLIVTHDPNVRSIADRVLRIRDGELVGDEIAA